MILFTRPVCLHLRVGKNTKQLKRRISMISNSKNFKSKKRIALFVSMSLLLVTGILFLKPIFGSPEQNPPKSIQLASTIVKNTENNNLNMMQAEETKIAESVDSFVESSTEIKETKTFNYSDVEENIIHTMTLQRTEPMKEGDEYAWMIISEPGQLSACINALGLGNPNPKMFGEDTSVVFAQDEINLEQIRNKFNLDINTPLVDNAPLTITYLQE